MAWYDGYRSYDDDTLATLANPGLLRRAAKDVEAGKIAWAEQGTEAGVVTADGQRVQLDARGPQQARCDCPAPGICKHILGAALWLRALEPAAPGSAAGAHSDEQQDRQAPPGADPLAEILALADAGKPLPHFTDDVRRNQGPGARPQRHPTAPAAARP